MLMQIGDLVEVLRSRDLATSGTIGILCDRWAPSNKSDDLIIWVVQLTDGHQIRYLQKDLKKLN